MENHVRNFGEEVNFLYNYIIEAHPDPEYAPCGSTEDLGWNHPSQDTRSMDERAQRARWLKADFDLTFPFMMDDMGNNILRTYWGSRFYSGWVIDCDGMVIEAKDWGWATPATQWCGLPLADNNELIGLLSQYVHLPPDCFDGDPQKRVTRVIPVVSRVDGLNDTYWRSDVVLANPHEQDQDVAIKLLGLGIDLPIKHVTLPGGASVEIADVVGTMFESEGTGSMWIEADRPIVAVARVATDGNEGVYGQLVRGLPPAHAIAQPMIGHLFPLEESPRLRTNIGLTNVADGESSVGLRFFSSDGIEYGSIDLTLDPGEHRLLGRALTLVTSGNVEGARVEVTASDEVSAVMAYASVVDNISGDPLFVEAVPHVFAYDVVLPGVAKSPGVDDTVWSSEVVLVNRDSRPVLVDAHYWERGVVNPASPPVQFELAARETRVIDDPVGTLFDREGSGAVVFSGLYGIGASGRTFNSGGSEGTFGQRVGGFDLTGEAILSGESTGHLIGLEESHNRRTNLGLVNVGAVGVQARVRFFNAAGTRIGVRFFSISAGSFIQLDRVFRSISESDVHAGRIEISLMEGVGRLAGYASTIDLGTGDPVYQPFWIEQIRPF